VIRETLQFNIKRPNISSSGDGLVTGYAAQKREVSGEICWDLNIMKNGYGTNLGDKFYYDHGSDGLNQHQNLDDNAVHRYHGRNNIYRVENCHIHSVFHYATSCYCGITKILIKLKMPRKSHEIAPRTTHVSSYYETSIKANGIIVRVKLSTSKIGTICHDFQINYEQV
jgi:hypothetical protein